MGYALPQTIQMVDRMTPMPLKPLMEGAMPEVAEQKIVAELVKRLRNEESITGGRAKAELLTDAADMLERLSAPAALDDSTCASSTDAAARPSAGVTACPHCAVSTDSVMNRRLNTRYAGAGNFLLSCRACFECAWRDYDEKWDDAGTGSPFSHEAPPDAEVSESNPVVRMEMVDIMMSERAAVPPDSELDALETELQTGISARDRVNFLSAIRGLRTALSQSQAELKEATGRDPHRCCQYNELGPCGVYCGCVSTRSAQARIAALTEEVSILKQQIPPYIGDP